MGFSTTYTSVTWTAGDTITEAKLDNMVANDQAYDSHAAEGLELDEMSKPSNPSNAVRIYAKDDSGTSKFYVLQDDGTEIKIKNDKLTITEFDELTGGSVTSSSSTYQDVCTISMTTTETSDIRAIATFSTDCDNAGDVAKVRCQIDSDDGQDVYNYYDTASQEYNLTAIHGDDSKAAGTFNVKSQIARQSGSGTITARNVRCNLIAFAIES